MISMVMPIFNEVDLLPYHLELAAPHIDQIILVDGSPVGPSNDGTRDFIDKADYSNVEIIEGVYEMADRLDGWDKQAQIREGVTEAQGDWLLITSCDTLFVDYGYIAEILENADGSVYYTYTREFFIDTQHIRLTPQNSYALPLVGYAIFETSLFDVEQPAFFKSDDVAMSNFVFLPDAARFHYGWVRDFPRQVARQKRNVKAGLWHEYGEQILQAGDEALDVWAITHVTHYAEEVAFPYVGVDHPLGELTFDYLEGFEEVLNEFSNNYGKTYYEAT